MKAGALLIFIFLIAASSINAQTIGIYNLKCEHLETPNSIDVEKPRFSWKIYDERYGAKQTSFKISVSLEGKEVWSSGYVTKDLRLFTYAGPPLKSFKTYTFKIEATDKDGSPYPSETSYFQTAFLQDSSWQGQWINDGKSLEYRPASYFVKHFEVDKPVKKARLYIATAGYHWIETNGQKIQKDFLAPSFTNYSKRVLFKTYDLDKSIKEGLNALGLIIGNGWFNHQAKTAWAFDKAPWRDRPGFILNLRLEFEDGTSKVITSDESWKIHQSPIAFNSIYLGENYDFNLEIENWSNPNNDISNWENAKAMQAPTSNIVAARMPPVMKTDTLNPISINKLSADHYVFKFPKNIAGVSEITASVKDNTLLEIRHGEVLFPNGSVNTNQFSKDFQSDNITEQFQTDFLQLKSGEFSFSPKFNYKGFQYVEIRGSKPIDLEIKNLKAFETHNSFPQLGSISTANEVVNGIWKISNNSYLSNAVGIPTDCPQREKNGWTGDAHMMSETGLYNYDAILFYEKWMRDHQDAQEPDGPLPSIIPTAGFGRDYAFDWTSSIILIPWDVYLMTGDDFILRENYSAMKKFASFYIHNSANLLQYGGFGDWSPAKTSTKNHFTSSAYFFKAVQTLSKIALTLKKYNDHVYFSSLSEDIKNRINQEFYQPKSGLYSSGTQTALAIAIDFNIVPEDQLEKVGQRLVENILSNNGFLDVGALGNKSLPNALIKIKRPDLALNMLKETQSPSWGNWVKLGLTSMPESWNYWGNYPYSSNHAFLGTINGWMYKNLGGINPNEEDPGFKFIDLKPQFDSSLGEINAEHESPYGIIKVNVTPKTEETFIYSVTIPAGSYATLTLPEKYQIIELLSQTIPEEHLPFEDENLKLHFNAGHYSFLISSAKQTKHSFPQLTSPQNIPIEELLVDKNSLFLITKNRDVIHANWEVINHMGFLIEERSINIPRQEKSFITDLSQFNGQAVIIRMVLTDIEGSSKVLLKRVKFIE